MDRRDFLRYSTFAAGGWLLAEGPLRVSAASAASAVDAAGFRPSPLIRLDRDGGVTLFVIKQEMGQGVRTALPLLLAEELDVDFERVRVEQLPYDAATAGQYNTWASGSIRGGWTSMRKAGAAARAMLVEAAAARWKVPASACATAPGRVVLREGGQSLPYTELLEAASALKVPADPAFKDPAAYRLVGKQPRRTDVAEKVSGRLRYGMDMTLPDMLYATVVRAPSFYARVRSVDDSAVRALGPGIVDVVRIQQMPGCDNRNGVAVLATSTWLALRAQMLLKVEWEKGDVTPPDTAAFWRELRSVADRDTPAQVFDAKGKSDGFALLEQGRPGLVQATYEMPFLTHAAMEPLNCIASFLDGRYDIWGGFQAPGFFASALPKAFRVDKSAIVLHPLPMGGAFGRKEKVDNAAEAMQLSRACGRPVKLVFSRPDDTRNGFYRPANVHRLQAVADAKGVQALRHQIAIATFPGKTMNSAHDIYGGAAGDLCYPVADIRSAFYPVESPLPTGSWRSIAYSHNVFAIESFIDELARHVRADPLRYRLQMLDQPAEDGQQEHRRRLAAVLERCGQVMHWNRPAAKGRWRGMACCVYTHTHAYVAHAFEISVNAKKQIKLHRVVCVLDCGLIVDSSGFRPQVEGSLAWALSAALKGEITVKDGEVEQQTFSDYEVLRLNDMPAFEIDIMPSTEAPGGAGEPAVPSVAPALCNALFAATGKRIHNLPLQKAGYSLA
jgi:isoquinoline 1-oxidoreductase beta subunit